MGVGVGVGVGMGVGVCGFWHNEAKNRRQISQFKPTLPPVLQCGSAFTNQRRLFVNTGCGGGKKSKQHRRPKVNELLRRQKNDRNSKV